MSVVANVAINVDARDAISQLNRVDDAADKLNGSFINLKNAIGALAIGAAVRSIVQVGEESQKSKNQLKALTAQYGEYNIASQSAERIQRALGISAIDAREGYSQLYAALRGTGVSAQQLEVLFVGLTKAAQMSGAGAAEAQGALIQLKQGFASGALSGDELRSVLEAMPALTQAVAKETDRLGLTSNGTAADLKRLGSEGKLTSDIVYRAAKSFVSATVPAKTASENFAASIKNFQEAVAEAFGPTATRLVTSFTTAVQAGGSWFKDNQVAISAIGKVFFDLAKTMAPLAIGVFAVVKAYQAWQVVSKAVAATQAFIVALTGPRGLALIAAAAGAAVIAYKGLEEVEKRLTAESVKQADATEKAKKETQALAAATQDIAGKAKPATDGLRSMATEAERGQRAVEAQLSALDRGASVTAARFAAEQAANQLRGQQLEREYELAKTAQQRLNIAIAIFNNQARAAEIEYTQALANIKLEETKTALQAQAAEHKLNQVKAAGKLAILEAKSVEEETKKKEQLKDAVEAQQQVIKGAQETSQAQQEISRLQKETAASQYESKVLTAQTAFESKATSQSIGLSQRDAARLSNNLGASTRQAAALNSTMNSVANNAQRAANAIMIIRGNSPTPTSGNFIKTHNASGGFINRPTATMVGEAGGEYIVPEYKAAEFAANYLSGARGTSALSGGGGSPTINITTGPVMQQGGQNYVTIQDMEAGLQAVADTILSNSRSYSARRFTGVV